MDYNYQTLERPSELQAKQQQTTEAACGTYDENPAPEKPYHPPTVLGRIEMEISHHEHERERGIRRSQGLSELASLLRSHPEVARILELKAELGL